MGSASPEPTRSLVRSFNDYAEHRSLDALRACAMPILVIGSSSPTPDTRAVATASPGRSSLGRVRPVRRRSLSGEFPRPRLTAHHQLDPRSRVGRRRLASTLLLVCNRSGRRSPSVCFRPRTRGQAGNPGMRAPGGKQPERQRDSPNRPRSFRSRQRAPRRGLASWRRRRRCRRPRMREMPDARGVRRRVPVAAGTPRAWNLISSSRPWPSGVSTIAYSTWTSSSATLRSTQPPSTDPLPCSLSPSSTKNAVAAARSSNR
jgi:hypothetical protein